MNPPNSGSGLPPQAPPGFAGSKHGSHAGGIVPIKDGVDKWGEHVTIQDRTRREGTCFARLIV